MRYMELTVWKKSMDLVDEVYALADGSPEKREAGPLVSNYACSHLNTIKHSGRIGKIDA